MLFCSDTYLKKENRKSIIIILLLIINVLITCKDETSTKQYNKEINNIGITLIDKTIMRIDPFINSSVITYINKGEIVTILNKSPEKDRIGNSRNFWYNVNYSKGYLGWIYGTSLKLFPVNNKHEIESYLSDLWGKELIGFRKKIAGKWGPSVKENLVPEQSLEIFEDGKYKSHQTGLKIIEGEYYINFKVREINFSNGTFFGNNIKILTSGNKYILAKGNKDSEMKLKKISSSSNKSGDELKKDKRSGA